LLKGDKFNYTPELEKRYLEYVNGENEQDMSCWVTIVYLISLKYIINVLNNGIK
jgi:hypothetical protein